MSYRRKLQRVSYIVLLSMVLVGMVPGQARADNELSLNFATSADTTLTQGVPQTIFFSLHNGTEDVTGEITATLTAPDGEISTYEVSGAKNPYALTDVTLKDEGVYTLTVTDQQGDSGTGFITVESREVKILTVGSLALNEQSHLTVKLLDSNGALAKKAVTVDGTGVGANPGTQNYTTLNDGTFVLTLTPTTTGLIKVIYAGDVVGTIPVENSLAQGGRIGAEAENNMELSVAVAQSGWTSTENVILTRDDQLTDALTAVPLSKALDAPILMTSAQELDEEVWTEISDLGAQNVYIIGGSEAIAGETEQYLKDNNLNVTRLAGSDRYDTAAQIAGLVGSQDGSQDAVYLASGVSEADALSISAFAAEQGAPILLTSQDQLPEATLSALEELSPSKVIILGGTGVISTELEDQLRLEYDVERWGGKDRYATEDVILENLFMPDSAVYLSTGVITGQNGNSQPSADAILTGALAAKQGGFVVTLPAESASFSLSTAPYDFLLKNKADIKSTTVVGNEQAVSNTLEESLRQLLGS